MSLNPINIAVVILIKKLYPHLKVLGCF